MSIQSGHYCHAAKSTFFGWTDKIANEHHITQGNATRMKSAFETRFSTVVSKKGIKEAKTSFIEWAKKAKSEGHLNSGNLNFIKKKIKEVTTDLKSKKVKTTKNKTASVSQKQIKAIAAGGFVAFYKNGPSEFLGNFSPCKITVWAKQFQCAEAAFQWKKYDLAAKNSTALAQDALRKQFFTATGDEAFQINKKLSAKYPKVFASGWLIGARDAAMWDVLQAKFSQSKEQLKLLQATGNAYLLEHNQVKGRDTYWSDDHDGTGFNMLGQMLMAIRDNTSAPRLGNRDGKTAAFAKKSQHIKSIF